MQTGLLCCVLVQVQKPGNAQIQPLSSGVWLGGGCSFESVVFLIRAIVYSIFTVRVEENFESRNASNLYSFQGKKRSNRSSEVSPHTVS